MNHTLRRIEELQLDIQDLTTLIEKERELAAVLEATEIINIVTAQNPETGKPLFTNDTQRQAALKINLSEQASYQTLLKQIAEGERQRVRLRAELERLRGEFKLHLLDRQEAIANSAVLV